MGYMNNRDIADAIANIKFAIDADPHDGTRHYVLSKLLKAGIIDTMPVSALDPYRPFPEDWTAMQISIFDNGEPEIKRNRAKVQRTKMRFGGNVKVWTGTSIDFSKKNQIAWTHNFYLWQSSIAGQVAQELQDDKCISGETVTMITSAASCAPEFHHSIPMSKGSGTRWLNEHLISVKIEDGFPTCCLFKHPAGHVVGDAFTKLTAGAGNALGGNCIAQVRISRNGDYDQWVS